MRGLCLVDLDDTVLNFGDAMQAFLLAKGYQIAERMRDHHNIPKLFNFSIEQTIDLISEFHRSPMMAQLEPEPSAVRVLPELYRQGFRFVAISACLNEPDIVRRREQNLEAAFGFRFNAVHCLGLTFDKSEALRGYEPSIWVEDMAEHAATGASLGHRAFLLDRPYNRDLHHPTVARVDDWYDIARQISRTAAYRLGLVTDELRSA